MKKEILTNLSNDIALFEERHNFNAIVGAYVSFDGTEWYEFDGRYFTVRSGMSLGKTKTHFLKASNLKKPAAKFVSFIHKKYSIHSNAIVYLSFCNYFAKDNNLTRSLYTVYRGNVMNSGHIMMIDPPTFDLSKTLLESVFSNLNNVVS